MYFLLFFEDKDTPFKFNTQTNAFQATPKDLKIIKNRCKHAKKHYLCSKIPCTIMKKSSLALILLLLTTNLLAQKTYRCSQFGIVNDSTKVQTQKFQTAIDRISSTGGGILILPAGAYTSGSIRLRDNVELRLEKNARLHCTTNPLDLNLRGFILSDYTKNVRITGEGTIDGHGLEVSLALDSLHHAGKLVDKNYYTERNRPNTRPKLLDFAGVQGLHIEGVTLRSSATWGLVMTLCRNVTIRNVNVDNRAYWNNDGIDVVDCKKVLIEGCRISSVDDGIVLKSAQTRAQDPGNTDITIRNCDICSGTNAFKIGTESYYSFRNITVRNIKIHDTPLSAIAIESVDGATIDGVTVDGVMATNTGNPLFIRLGNRKGRTGELRNVTIRNLTCQVPFTSPDAQLTIRNPQPSSIHNPFPCVIAGIPNSRIKNVIFENIDITFPGKASKAMGYIPDFRHKDIPERENAYPEHNMFGELPAWGFYLRHIDGVRFTNVNIRTSLPDFRHATVFDDVKGMKGPVNVK